MTPVAPRSVNDVSYVYFLWQPQHFGECLNVRLGSKRCILQ